MFINEKLFNLLTDFADCYDANLVPVVPTHPNLTYIAFKNAKVRDAIIPLIKERFTKEHDDDLIFRRIPFDNNSWESTAYIKSMIQHTIDTISAVENEIKEAQEKTYFTNNIDFEIYNKCCYCFDRNQVPIELINSSSISEVEYFIFKSALYKTLFNDFLKRCKRTLIETSINDMCFCWSEDYKEWESINHKLMQPTALRNTQSLLEQYKRTHNELENI